MNRRDFFSGSLALVAAAGLPRAIRKTDMTPTIYRTVLKPNVADQHQYEISIYHDTLTSFSSASDIDKIITLRVKYYETTDTSKATRSSEFKYKIKKVTANNGAYDVETKLDQKPSGDFKFPRNYPKDLKFKVRTYEFVNALGKDDEKLFSIPYPSSSSSGDDLDCFLTTACVYHRKMADDCYELNSLRDLRDNFMMNTADGREIVKNYREVGPSLIRSINACENSSEIYEYMYQHLVVPSVSMVKEGKKQEAVDYYQQFVIQLKQEYFQ